METMETMERNGAWPREATGAQQVQCFCKGSGDEDARCCHTMIIGKAMNWSIEANLAGGHNENRVETRFAQDTHLI